MIPIATIDEILKHIPHRFPFLLIDRMEACEPNKWVRVAKNVTNDEWFFAHAPLESRVMPQILVLEALAQTAGVLCHYSGMMSRIGKSIIFFAGIEKFQYRRDVLPGDQLKLECTLKRSLRGVAKLSGAAWSTTTLFSRGITRSDSRDARVHNHARHLKHLSLPYTMGVRAMCQRANLQPCPFCAHRKPKIVVSPQDKVERIRVVCPECGAYGPIATRRDPSGHAEFLWNQRHGSTTEH